MPRTGVFGGSFDPPHVGHLIVAQDVVENLSLDRLLLVPAARSPHKATEAPAPAEARVRMLEAAIGDHPKLEVSRIEVDRGGASYTVDTLQTLREASPADDLFLLIGADQLRAFASWRAPDEVARLAKLVVMARDGVSAEGADPLLDVTYETVAVTRVDVSSTDIRRRLREGRSIRYLVPEAVRRIIEVERIYSR